jgi:hypothetical protein
MEGTSMSPTTKTSFSGTIDGRPLSTETEKAINHALKSTLEAEITKELAVRVTGHGSGDGSGHGSGPIKK